MSMTVLPFRRHGVAPTLVELVGETRGERTQIVGRRRHGWVDRFREPFRHSPEGRVIRRERAECLEPIRE